jgi:hypothetical protein
VQVTTGLYYGSLNRSTATPTKSRLWRSVACAVLVFFSPGNNAASTQLTHVSLVCYRDAEPTHGLLWSTVAKARENEAGGQRKSTVQILKKVVPLLTDGH